MSAALKREWRDRVLNAYNAVASLAVLTSELEAKLDRCESDLIASQDASRAFKDKACELDRQVRELAGARDQRSIEIARLEALLEGERGDRALITEFDAFISGAVAKCGQALQAIAARASHAFSPDCDCDQCIAGLALEAIERTKAPAPAPASAASDPTPTSSGGAT